MKYRKKPVVIEATQWFKAGDHPAVISFEQYEKKRNVAFPADYSIESFLIETLEGHYNVAPGDWIITGVNGEHYPCKPDIFEKTYEPAE